MSARVSSFIFLFACTFCLSIDVACQTFFEDVTAEIGLERVTMSDTHGSGASIEDFDNDGDLDIYLCVERGLSDRLYRNDNGVFQDVASDLGLEVTTRSRMAIWFDFNADGLLDLLVAGDCDFDEADCDTDQLLRLFLQGESNFYEITEEVGLVGFGAQRKDQTVGGISAADINLDGYLDVVFTIRNGPLNVFLNNKGTDFIDVTDSLGLNAEDYKYYQPLLADLNNDHWPELYLNVDFGSNYLYLNEGGFYKDVSIQSRANESANEMGVALGDYDNDGDFDIYSTNIYGYLGRDVHNVLLENKLETDYLYFEEVSKSSGVENGGWGWGASFADYDNDGYLDIATTNGWDLPFEVIDQSKLWKNNGDKTFTDISNEAGFNDSLNAATLISADMNSDGYMDILQTLKGEDTSNNGIRVLLNNGTIGNYLSIKLEMGGRNKHGIGSKVFIYNGDQVLSRQILVGTSFYGQEPSQVHFGLGTSEKVDSLHIVWPTGGISKFYDIAANQHLEIGDDDLIHPPVLYDLAETSRGNWIRWKDINHLDVGYIVERSETYTFDDFVAIPVVGDSYLDREVDTGSIYYYRIKATYDSMDSNYSNSKWVTSIITGLFESENQFKVYPNPIRVGNNRPLIVTLDEPVLGDIQIYNARGLRIPFKYFEEQDRLQIDITNLKGGMYYLKVGKRSVRFTIN